MQDKKPTHEQGQLQLQLYDLRREANLRQARDWFTQSYFVDSFEDSQRIAPFGSQEGTWSMVRVDRVAECQSHRDRSRDYVPNGMPSPKKV